MNGTSDIGKAEMYGDEGGLDPREAARLLERTHRQAQRELDFRSPWLSLLAAAAALVAFGSVWLSVRGQHPYKWPTPVGLLGLYAVVAIRIGSVLYAHRPRQRRRQRTLGTPDARAGSGPRGGFARCVRAHGGTRGQRSE